MSDNYYNRVRYTDGDRTLVLEDPERIEADNREISPGLIKGETLEVAHNAALELLTSKN